MHSPLFVKLTMQALATVTSDNAMLENVARVNQDPAVKYQPEATRINYLSKLLKVNPNSLL